MSDEPKCGPCADGRPCADHPRPPVSDQTPTPERPMSDWECRVDHTIHGWCFGQYPDRRPPTHADCGWPAPLPDTGDGPDACPLLVDLAAWVDAGEDATDPIHAHLWEPNNGPGHPGCGPCQLAVLRFRDNPKATR